jgi:hypothetical protein
MSGFSRPGTAASPVIYHPSLAGMTAVAAALDKMLAR